MPPPPPPTQARLGCLGCRPGPRARGSWRRRAGAVAGSQRGLRRRAAEAGLWRVVARGRLPPPTLLLLSPPPHRALHAPCHGWTPRRHPAYLRLIGSVDGGIGRHRLVRWQQRLPPWQQRLPPWQQRLPPWQQRLPPWQQAGALPSSRPRCCALNRPAAGKEGTGEGRHMATGSLPYQSAGRQERGFCPDRVWLVNHAMVASTYPGEGGVVCLPGPSVLTHFCLGFQPWHGWLLRPGSQPCHGRVDTCAGRQERALCIVVSHAMVALPHASAVIYLSIY
jgi:hypothetical protein